jgi:hypothetical protein
MATFNSQIYLDYSSHSFRHLSFASHPHSPCISRISLVSAITLPCLSRFIITRNHRARSLAFIYYPQIILPYLSRLITIHNHPAICLAYNYCPRFSGVTLPCLCNLTQPHGLLCLICMPRHFVSLNAEACLECSPVTHCLPFIMTKDPTDIVTRV